MALNALAEELENRDSPNRMKAASEILRLAQLPAGSQGISPSDPGEIVRQIVTERRRQAHSPLDDLLDDGKGLPPFDRHMEETWRELEASAADAEREATAE